MENKQLIILILAILISACIIGCAIYFGLSEKNNDNIVAESSNKTNVTSNITEDTVQNSYSEDDNGPVYEESYYKGGVAKHESENGNDGWVPSEHEVSRESMDDDSYKINYDDGYFRICDSNGYIITYGYG